MKNLVFTAAFCILALMTVPSVHADADAPDPITAKLDKARTTFNTDMEKFRTAVRGWYDKMEASARNDGNKDRVDQIKADREAFEASDDLPPTVPTTLRDKRVAARAPMEVALRTAIKQYTLAKRDSDADAVLKELDEFLASDAPRAVVSKLVTTTWVHKGHYVYTFYRNGTYAIVGSRRHGKFAISRDAKQILLRWEGESHEDEVIVIDHDRWSMDGVPFTPQK